MLRAQLHLLLVAPLERKQSDARERWIFQLLAEFDLLIVEAHEVVAARVLNRRMKRRERLHEDLALDIAPPRAPGDLRDQLKGPFARAKVGNVQRQVGVNNSDERHVRKVQALRNHLRADKDVDLADA